MIFPQYLQKGDRIRIIAPAGKVSKEKVLPGIELLQETGYDVLIGNHVFDRHFQYAGTDHQREVDVQEAISDPLTRAIICARGGYGSVRIIEKLNFIPFLESPKWLVGFSDVTVLHSVLNSLHIASVHGAMPGSFMENKKPLKSFHSLMEALTSGNSQVEMEGLPLNRNGKCSGELVGGNISLLYSLQGTPWQLDTRGKILFLEDVSEYLYHLDRMMQNLRLSGQLKHLSGLVVGGLTEMKGNESPFGKSACEIILDAVQDYHFPVCFDFPAGHIPRNLSLILGAQYALNVESKCTLKRIHP
ncbi:MAG TPA: LD-carboxypeptidase [Prolixibacteraceae bacterium]|jgi:muramoyltetrapeptide carboxypeptidase|nr:LD-carboxypeptidase [Prolixibacteraceae bacterium]